MCEAATCWVLLPQDGKWSLPIFFYAAFEGVCGKKPKVTLDLMPNSPLTRK